MDTRIKNDVIAFAASAPIIGSATSPQKARRTVENGFYINEIPMGSLGDVSADPHMREIPYPEAGRITFFIYEEILACKNACRTLGLSKDDIKKIFYENSAKIFG